MSCKLASKSVQVVSLGPTLIHLVHTPSSSSNSVHIQNLINTSAKWASSIWQEVSAELIQLTKTDRQDWMVLRLTSHCWLLRSALELWINKRLIRPSEAASLLKSSKTPSLAKARQPWSQMSPRRPAAVNTLLIRCGMVIVLRKWRSKWEMGHKMLKVINVRLDKIKNWC